MKILLPFSKSLIIMFAVPTASSILILSFISSLSSRVQDKVALLVDALSLLKYYFLLVVFFFFWPQLPMTLKKLHRS